VPLPPDWTDLVQLDVSDETQDLRLAIRRSAPFGPKDWREQIAARLQMESGLSPIGRPNPRKRQLQFPSER
jgi:hypothetical protein